MTTHLARIAKLEQRLRRVTELTPDDQMRCFFDFERNLRNGCGNPSDLADCTLMTEGIQYGLIQRARDMQDLVDAGTPPPLDYASDWAARALTVPFDDEVPQFITNELAQLFESAWINNPVRTVSISPGA